MVLSDIHLGTSHSKTIEVSNFLKSVSCDRLILNSRKEIAKVPVPEGMAAGWAKVVPAYKEAAITAAMHILFIMVFLFVSC